MQRRTSLLGTLDEVDGQANNPIAVKLELPDHELPGNSVAASTFAGKIQTGGIPAESEPLGAMVFTDLEELAVWGADVKMPAID